MSEKIEKVTEQEENVKAIQEVKQEKTSKAEAKKVVKKTIEKKAANKPATKKAKEKQEKKEVVKELPPIQYNSLSSNSKNTAIHSLMIQIKNNMLNLDHEVQRKSSQWKLEQQEKFLNSCIIGVIPPEIVIAQQGEEKFVLDGKQRLETLYSYCCKPDDPKFNPKLKVFGRTFAELDETTKDVLTGANINVVTYADCSDKEIFELFERYNNGVSLSTAQKSRSYCSIELLNKIKELLNSGFVSEKCNITKGQSLKDEDTIVLIQACMIVSEFDFKSFNGKEVDRYLQETDTASIMQTLDVIEEHINILDSIVSDRNKNLKKIHLPMVLACANNTEEFSNKLLNFLNDYENQTEYRQYCQGSTSQKENVLGRLNFWRS